jgi:DNA-binding transcriptional MerR regulator
VSEVVRAAVEIYRGETLMSFTIKQVSEKVNLSVYTLRYYDKEGLLPFITRDQAGNRVFHENDLDWLDLICCLKNTGMPIKQIGTFIQWCMEGDASLNARREMLIEHRQTVIQQINELQDNLEAIKHKIDHYNRLCKTPGEVKSVYSLAHEME